MQGARVASATRPVPAWLFVFAGTSYGVTGAFIAQIMPFLADGSGVSLEAIGWFSALLFVPSALQFAYAPLVDAVLPRRIWLIAVSAASGVCLVAAFAMSLPDHLHAFLAFGFAAQVLSGLISASAGGLLIDTMPDERRGAASAWYNAGFVIGAGVAATTAIGLSGVCSPIVIGIIVAAILAVPACAVLAIVEMPPTAVRSMRAVAASVTRDTRKLLATRTGLTGLLLCLSPIGTAALTNFFAGMKHDFEVSDRVVALVTGAVASIAGAVGALGGGYLADRFNRRAVYLLSGVLVAVCSFAMALAPLTLTTYCTGVAVYSAFTGFGYSAFTAMVLETIDVTRVTASTQYAVFVSAGNIAIQYVGLIDTRFRRPYGIRGVFTADAILNLGGVALFALLLWRCHAFGARRGAR